MKIQCYDKEVTDELMNLLLQADPDESAITGYLNDSLILVALDGVAIVGVTVLFVDHDQGELKNISVKDIYQGRGIAKLLILEAKRVAKVKGATSLKVATGNSSLSQLALYQKCGFRMQGIRPDFFLSYPEPIFENGIRCLDMVVLSTEL